MLGSSVFFAVNSAFMGYWNATERANLYLRVVIIKAVVNVPLNYVFMFGLDPVPAYGVTGAGIGTFLASLVGAICHIYMGLKYAPGFHRGVIGEHFRVVIRLMVPVGMQQFMDALALTLMFRIVAFVGTVEVAAYSVLVNMISAVGMPAWGLGLAGATLVGQSMGAKQMDEANRWAWDVIKIGGGAMMLLGVPFWLVPELILGVFIHEPEALAAAIVPCRVLGVMIGINGIGYLFASMLNGAGDVKRVMYVNLATQYLVLLPGAYVFGIYFGFGLMGIWLTHQIGFRALNSVILTTLWRQKRWQKVELW
jgi:putative MATE family efflux protein